MFSTIIDDKSEHCVPFILERLKKHQEKFTGKGDDDIPPFFIGLNGVQGAGKTTLVSTLYDTLSSPPYSLPTVVLSIDDLYLTHDDQHALGAANPQNPLVQHRGEPSTHDIDLALKLFDSLDKQQPTQIPSYDKSAYNGQGDRAPDSTWRTVNAQNEPKVKVVLFEGWCVGFRPLSPGEVSAKLRVSQATVAEGENGEPGEAGGGGPPSKPRGELWKHTLANVTFVNDALKKYNALTDRFDAFIHIDAEDTSFVYDWRLQQEAKMREEKGKGMTDEQVVNFVDGYYPAYELYTDKLRSGIFPDEKDKQLRLVVGKDRKVRNVYKT